MLKLRMTNTHFPTCKIFPQTNEIYLCTMVDVNSFNGSFWIRGFEPRIVTEGLDDRFLLSFVNL